MKEFVHAARDHEGTGERTYRLSNTALVWQEGDTSGELSFADTECVRLRLTPVLGGSHRKGIVSGRGDIDLLLLGQHFDSASIPQYHGPSKFGLLLNIFERSAEREDRTATYAPLIRELLARVAAANPQARFRAGSTTAFVIWLLVFLVFAALTSLLVLALLGGAGLAVLGPIILGAALSYIAWRGVRRGPARPFDPHHPPLLYLRPEPPTEAVQGEPAGEHN